MLLVTSKEPNVPTWVIPVCEAVPIEPFNVVAVTVVADKMFVSLSNVNVESAPKSPPSLKITWVFEPAGCCKSQGLPFAYCRLSVCNVPVAVVPVTDSAVNVPTLVIFGWAAVVIVDADPVTLPEISAVTVKPLKVPTEVIINEVKVERLLREYGAKAVVIRNDYTVFEATGQGEEINKLLKKLDKFGLIEFVRSSRIAIINASEGIHKKVVEMEQKNPALQTINNEFLDKKDQVFQM